MLFSVIKNLSLLKCNKYYLKIKSVHKHHYRAYPAPLHNVTQTDILIILPKVGFSVFVGNAKLYRCEGGTRYARVGDSSPSDRITSLFVILERRWLGHYIES